MRFMPETLVTFVAKELAKYLLNKLFKLLVDWEGSSWQKDRETNFQDSKEFYQWIDQRIGSWQQKTAQQ